MAKPFPPNLGDMRSRVYLQAHIETQDAMGGFVHSWGNVVENPIWAKIEPYTGREEEIGKSNQAELTHTITIRWRGVNAVIPTMRFQDELDGSVYQIVSTYDVDHKHIYLQCDCKLTTNSGSGPQGPQGIQTTPINFVPGPVGPQGYQGPKGNQGSQGPVGSQGSVGAIGPQGVQGSTGSQGPSGLQGPQGQNGIIGANGSQGSQGSTGATGLQGPQGPFADGSAITCRSFSGGTLSVPSTTVPAIAVWSGPSVLLGNDFTLANNDSKIYINSSGTYEFSYGWNGLSTFGTTSFILKNGTTHLTGSDVDSAGDSLLNLTFSADLTAGDYVELAFLLDSAGSPDAISDEDLYLNIVHVAAGQKGDTGATGLQGFQGPIGNTGAQGATGSAGSAGAQGSQGPTGASGSNGSQGSQGPIGPQGSTGNTGATGSQGVQGPSGSNGSQGPQGNTGATGSSGSNGSQGPIGPQGFQGNVGLPGGLIGEWIVTNTSPPPSGHIYLGSVLTDLTQDVTQIHKIDANGVDWTSYFEYIAPNLGTNCRFKYTKNNGSSVIVTDFSVWTTWPPSTSYVGYGANNQYVSTLDFNVGDLISWEFIVGGTNGATGARGFQGFQGNQGPIGPQGATGSTGSSGSNGAQGSQGPQGPSGSNGTNGTNGSQGAQGPQGSTGSTGNTGASGAQGSQGPQGPSNSGWFNALLGDGSDGNVTFDGTTTIAGMAPTGNATYTMTRDYYFGNVTINAGIGIITSGYRIFCTGTFTNNSNSGPQWNGTTGTGGTVSTSASTGLSSSGWWASTAGGAVGPNNGGVGSTGRCLGGLGGKGGDSGTKSGGALGSIIASPNNIMHNAAMAACMLYPAGNAFTQNNGGLGGSSGGGDGSNFGGPGGSGGGVVWIACSTFVNNGTIQAVGGAGVQGGTNGNTGGGGGGGGGAIIVLCNTNSATGTLNVNGGAHANATGTGTNANVTNGSPGNSVVFVIT